MTLCSRPRWFSLLALVTLFTFPAGSRAQGGTTAPYVNPAQLTGVPFGAHSHWAQPWRAYLETTPASTFLNGTGVVWGGGDLSQVAVLAAHGFKHLRVEVSWNEIDFNDPSKLDDSGSLAALLKACKAAGVRPLLLLNGNTGVPCPTRFSQGTVAADVKAGDMSITFRDAADFAVNRTGLTNVSGYAAARPLFTAISANADGSSTVKLSQPCPIAFTAGQQIPISTLKYTPFTADGSDDYKATIAGWQWYVLTVARFARMALGTAPDAHADAVPVDGGFDLEIWNELTFGSDFLDAKNYGLPAAPDMPVRLVQATAATAATDPPDFTSVGLSDGFASTTPWPASSSLPLNVAAISKHPYHGVTSYPAGGGTNLNALYVPDAYEPTYRQCLPEYYGTLIQTESLIRDASPLTDSSFSYAGIHGRNVRPGRPCPVWVTEFNIDGLALPPDRADVAFLRAYCFYLNKGCTQFDWFNLSAVTAAEMAETANVCAQMKAGLDLKDAPRSLRLESVSDTHGHFQFKGDGTPAHPALYDRDVFAFLPFQVNAHRFVVPYYVMTRDVAKPLAPESFSLTLSGLTGPPSVRALDPATGLSVPVTVRPLTATKFDVAVSATDAVRLLVIDDGRH